MSSVIFSSLSLMSVRSSTVLSKYFQTSIKICAVDKTLLAKLRKSTGFSISHCKKSLELHENDLEKAEEWLRKEAQAHGWEKATKLSGRSTTQGLIGIQIEGNVGNVIEVNCETDFVARNSDFHILVSNILKEFSKYPSSSVENIENPIKQYVDKEEIGSIKTSEGKTLSDLIALTIGKIGENIKLSRGIKFISPPGLNLMGYAHPPNQENMFGKYGAVVAFRNSENEALNRELCAHIVGMNPKAIGLLSEVKKVDEPEDRNLILEENEAEEEEGEEKKPKRVEEEKPLVHQEFLSDSDTTVGQVLIENEIEIVDFIRVECGEQLPEA